MRRSLRDRIAALERGAAVVSSTGFAYLWVMVHADGSRSASEVIALDIKANGEHQRVDRLPGESLHALERRANPRGTWHAEPYPVFRDAKLTFEQRLAEFASSVSEFTRMRVDA